MKIIMSKVEREKIHTSYSFTILFLSIFLFGWLLGTGILFSVLSNFGYWWYLWIVIPIPYWIWVINSDDEDEEPKKEKKKPVSIASKRKYGRKKVTFYSRGKSGYRKSVSFYARVPRKKKRKYKDKW